jgi:hypothetical protein
MRFATFAPTGADGFYPRREGGAMDTRRSPDIDVIKDAERIVYQAKWRICEERAAEQLAATSSLKWTRLFPESPAIQVVAIDGVVVGCIRHNGGRWIATGTRQRGRSPIATPSAPQSWPWHAKQSRGDRKCCCCGVLCDSSGRARRRPARQAIAPRAASAALYETCDRWSEPDDYRLSLEETVEQSERRRARWPCSRLLELLGPGISRVG